MEWSQSVGINHFFVGAELARPDIAVSPGPSKLGPYGLFIIDTFHNPGMPPAQRIEM